MPLIPIKTLAGIDLGGQKITNAGNGTAATDAVAYGQVTGLSAVTPSGGTLAITGALSTSGTATVNDIIAKGPMVDVRWYGAKGDGKATTGTTMSAGSATLTIGGPFFSNADVGKVAIIIGAGVGTTVTDAAMTAGSATFTSATATFTSADIGKWVTLAGAGAAGAVLSGTISTIYSATQAKLSVSASTTVSAATLTYSNALATKISSVTSSTVAVLAATATTAISGSQAFVATDDSAAFQSAVDGNGSVTTGATILVPAGIWYIPHVSVTFPHRIVGEGPSATILMGGTINGDGTANTKPTLSINTSADNGGVARNRINAGGVENLSFASANTTTVAALAIGNTAFFQFNNLRFHSAYYGKPGIGITIENANQLYFNQVRITGMAQQGVYIWPSTATAGIIEMNFSSQCQFDSNGSHGIQILNDRVAAGSVPTTEGIHIQDASFYNNGGYGLLMQGTNTGISKTLHLEGTVLDSNILGGARVELTGGYKGAGFLFNDVWCSFNGSSAVMPATTAGHGIALIGIYNWNIVGGCSIINGGAGIYVDNSDHGRIEATMISNNNQKTGAVAGGGYGIQIVSTSGASTNIKVLGNRIYNDTLSAGRNGDVKMSGISIDSGVTDVEIQNNYCATGATTTPFSIPLAAFTTNRIRETDNVWTDANLAAFKSWGNVAVGSYDLTPTSGVHVMGGGVRAQSLSVPVVTIGAIVGGAAGAYSYWVIAEDRFGNRTGYTTAVSTATGPTTFDGTHYVPLSWPVVPGAVKYYLLRNTTSTIAANTLAATITTSDAAATVGLNVTDTTISYNDTNATATGTFALPNHNATADSRFDGQVAIGIAAGSSVGSQVPSLYVVGNTTALGTAVSTAAAFEGTSSGGRGGEILLNDSSSGSGKKWIRSNGSTLQVLNNAYSNALFTVGETGALAMNVSAVNQQTLTIGGTTPLSGTSTVPYGIALSPTLALSNSSATAAAELYIVPTATFPTSGTAGSVSGIRIANVGGTASTSTLTNYYGINVASFQPSAVAGLTTTNAYGLYVSAPSGAATSNIAIAATASDGTTINWRVDGAGAVNQSGGLTVGGAMTATGGGAIRGTTTSPGAGYTLQSTDTNGTLDWVNIPSSSGTGWATTNSIGYQSPTAVGLPLGLGTAAVSTALVTTGGSLTAATTQTGMNLSFGASIGSQTNAAVTGLVVGGTVSGAGTTPTLTGIQVNAFAAGTTPSGTIANLYGINVAAMSLPTGMTAPATAYGLYVNAPTAGTTNIGISNAGTSLFAGKVTMSGGVAMTGAASTPVVGYALTATDTSGTIDWKQIADNNAQVIAWMGL